jgi:FG-GAP-like repeat
MVDSTQNWYAIGIGVKSMRISLVLPYARLRTRRPGKRHTIGTLHLSLLLTAIVGFISDVALAGTNVFVGALNASSSVTQNRLLRDGASSNCGVRKSFQGTLAQASTQYQVGSYTHKGPARCVTFTLSSTTCGFGTPGALLSLYSGPFDPSNLATNYLGDIGTSAAGDTAGVNLTAGQTIQLVVSGVGAGLNCSFSVESDDPLSSVHDFNNDARSDILWRDDVGDLGIWLMNGAQALLTSEVGSVSLNWSIVGQRDFNGDGFSDLLWRDTSGNTAIWFMNGVAVAASGGVGNIPTNWSVVGTGDFDGDGRGDIVWVDGSGNVAVWLMNGAAIVASAGIGTVPPSVWAVAGIGDFNGDGKSDVLWRDTSGNIAIWFMNGTQVALAAFVGTVSTVWSVVSSADFDGDGKSDILWRDNSSGNNAVWFMNGTLIGSAVGIANVPTTWTVQSVNAE